MNSIQVRPLVEADLDNLRLLIKSKPSMYGVNLADYHDSFISNYKTDNANHPIAVEVDGEFFGCIAQHFWAALPYWSMGSMFLKNETHNALSRRVIHEIFNYCIARGELNNRFNFFYVTRDTGRTRFDWVFGDVPPLIKRYDIVDLEILRPGSISNFSFVRNLLGTFSGKNTKTVVVRMGHLLAEFRKLP